LLLHPGQLLLEVRLRRGSQHRQRRLLLLLLLLLLLRLGRPQDRGLKPS
jgi:hypothetical protein